MDIETLDELEDELNGIVERYAVQGYYDEVLAGLAMVAAEWAADDADTFMGYFDEALDLLETVH